MTTKSDVEDIKKKRYAIMGEILVEQLKARQFDAYYCDSGDEAVDKAISLMPSKASVSWGGSATIDEIGLLKRVMAGPYKVLDRAEAKTPAEKLDVMRRAMFVDFFLTSFNGVSMDGTIFNIDGVGNRIAAITFGPSNVIAVVGMNKVCKTQESALSRAEDVAAQMNAVRFGSGSTLYTEDDVTEDNCSKSSLCNYIEQIRFCREPGRIKVILVGEDLGF